LHIIRIENIISNILIGNMEEILSRERINKLDKITETGGLLEHSKSK
jgi:hypothetical protein